MDLVTDKQRVQQFMENARRLFPDITAKELKENYEEIVIVLLCMNVWKDDILKVDRDVAKCLKYTEEACRNKLKKTLNGVVVAVGNNIASPEEEKLAKLDLFRTCILSSFMDWNPTTQSDKKEKTLIIYDNTQYDSIMEGGRAEKWNKMLKYELGNKVYDHTIYCITLDDFMKDWNALLEVLEKETGWDFDLSTFFHEQENLKQAFDEYLENLGLVGEEDTPWPIYVNEDQSIVSVIQSESETLSKNLFNVHFNLVVFDCLPSITKSPQFIFAASLICARRRMVLFDQVCMEEKDEHTKFINYMHALALTANKDSDFFELCEIENYEEVEIKFRKHVFFMNGKYKDLEYWLTTNCRKDQIRECLYEELEDKDKIQEEFSSEEMDCDVVEDEDPEEGTASKPKVHKRPRMTLKYGAHKDAWLSLSAENETGYVCDYLFVAPSSDELATLRQQQLSAENNVAPSNLDKIKWFGTTFCVMHSRMWNLNQYIQNTKLSEGRNIYFIISSYMEFVLKTTNHEQSLVEHTAEEKYCEHCKTLKKYKLNNVSKDDIRTRIRGCRGVYSVKQAYDKKLHENRRNVLIMADVYSFGSEETYILRKMAEENRPREDEEKVDRKLCSTMIWLAVAGTVSQRKCRLYSYWMYSMASRSYRVKKPKIEYRNSIEERDRICEEVQVRNQKVRILYPVNDIRANYIVTTLYVIKQKNYQRKNGGLSKTVSKLLEAFQSNIKSDFSKAISSYMHEIQKESKWVKQYNLLTSELANIRAVILDPKAKRDPRKTTRPKLDLKLKKEEIMIIQSILALLSKTKKQQKEEVSYTSLYEKVSMILNIELKDQKRTVSMKLDPMVFQFFCTCVLIGDKSRMYYAPPSSSRVILDLLNVAVYQNENLKIVQQEKNEVESMDLTDFENEEQENLLLGEDDREVFAEGQYATPHITVPTMCMLATCIGKMSNAYLRVEPGKADPSGRGDEEPSMFYAVNSVIVCFFGPRAEKYLHDYLDLHKVVYEDLVVPTYAISSIKRYLYRNKNIKMQDSSFAFACGDYNWKLLSRRNN